MNGTYDVAIVGYGPIGAMAAIMLGRRGHRVAVLDRWPQIYPLPRAVVYDDEIAGLFQREGLLGDVRAITDPVPDHYEWRNREDEALLKIDWSVAGPTGRQVANFFSQPDLQGVLDRSARRTPGVDVYQGWQVERVEERDDAVVLSARRGERQRDGSWVGSDETSSLRAAFVIGADGANSTIREQMGVSVEDLGFQFDWLIVDTRPHEQREWRPMNWQLCDPRRPTTIVSGGPGRRRWEFMRLPHETIEELNTPEKAWSLMEPWGRSPENTTIERHAVYTFQARWAREWRRGRLLLAGDAAHLMPPFAGQGMCSGLRDVANLVWKLDLVLSDRAPVELLDTYGTERVAHVQHFIHVSVALGEVICVLDEQRAAERDARMIAGGADPAKVLPPGPPPQLGDGALRKAAPAGLLMPQGRVAREGVTGLFDELVAPGMLLLARGPVASALHGDDLKPLAAVDGRALQVGPAADAPDLVDMDGFYDRWFEQHNAYAVVVRPDGYIFGTAATAAEVPELIADLNLIVTTAGRAAGAAAT